MTRTLLLSCRSLLLHVKYIWIAPLSPSSSGCLLLLLNRKVQFTQFDQSLPTILSEEHSHFRNASAMRYSNSIIPLHPPNSRKWWLQSDHNLIKTLCTQLKSLTWESENKQRHEEGRLSSFNFAIMPTITAICDGHCSSNFCPTFYLHLSIN